MHTVFWCSHLSYVIVWPSCCTDASQIYYYQRKIMCRNRVDYLIVWFLQNITVCCILTIAWTHHVQSVCLQIFPSSCGGWRSQLDIRLILENTTRSFQFAQIVFLRSFSSRKVAEVQTYGSDIFMKLHRIQVNPFESKVRIKTQMKTKLK